MSDNSKPVVRLDRGQPSKPAVKKGEPAAEQPIKLAVRLNEGVNDALRNLIRYRGDLSKMAYEALTTIDLATVDLVSVDEPMVADTTISMPRRAT